jgi:hypothetical protein
MDREFLAMNVEYVVCYGCIMWTILDVVDLGRGQLVWVDVPLIMCIKPPQRMGCSGNVSLA